jgi:hypothetical protein
VIAVETLSSLYTQNSYPTAGTGTVTVQVPVQIAYDFGATKVGVVPGVMIDTGGTCAAGNPVAFVSIMALGVPRFGVVSMGLVIVCTPVNVFAASVRAIVADVDGKV